MQCHNTISSPGAIGYRSNGLFVNAAVVCSAVVAAVARPSTKWARAQRWHRHMLTHAVILTYLTTALTTTTTAPVPSYAIAQAHTHVSESEELR